MVHFPVRYSVVWQLNRHSLLKCRMLRFNPNTRNISQKTKPVAEILGNGFHLADHISKKKMNNKQSLCFKHFEPPGYSSWNVTIRKLPFSDLNKILPHSLSECSLYPFFYPTGKKKIYSLASETTSDIATKSVSHIPMKFTREKTTTSKHEINDFRSGKKSNAFN